MDRRDFLKVMGAAPAAGAASKMDMLKAAKGIPAPYNKFGLLGANLYMQEQYKLQQIAKAMAARGMPVRGADFAKGRAPLPMNAPGQLSHTALRGLGGPLNALMLMMPTDTAKDPIYEANRAEELGEQMDPAMMEEVLGALMEQSEKEGGYRSFTGPAGMIPMDPKDF